MYEFDYVRPGSIDEAVKALQAEDAQALAGGQTLIPTLKQRLAQPSVLVDLSACLGRDVQIVRDGDCEVGGGATHATVATSDHSPPWLRKVAEGIGDPQVRNRGTIGGSIANNDPAADYPAAVVGLGATVRTNKREIAADDFFVGLFETALEEGEIVTQVAFPVPEKAAYAKFHNPASRYAIVGVFASQGPAGTRVAVTGAGPCVFRAKQMEDALGGGFSAAALDGITVSADGLNSDLHASAEYRAHLVGVMAKRAVAAAGG